MINFILVEDNDVHRKSTEKIILKYMMKNKYEFEIFSYDKENKKLDDYIKNNDDNSIYILDFELPNTNALDLARLVRTYDWRSPIIILTAHGGMAFESFKQRLQILDFISKQYHAEKSLIESFDICMKQFNITKSLKLNYNYTDYNIPFDKILYIYRDTVERKIIVVTENSEYKIRINMKDIKKLLPNYFKYSHKACIVNMNKVEAFDWKNYIIYFSNGTSSYLLSRTHKKELMKK